MKERLSSIAPDVVEVLASSPTHQVQAVARRAAGWAASATELLDPRVSAALGLLADGRIGPSPERSALARYAAELDQRAWEIQGQVDQGRAKEADYLGAFSQARAASAICFALDEDPRAGAADAVYEAYAATGALDDLREIVRGALRER